MKKAYTIDNRLSAWWRWSGRYLQWLGLLVCGLVGLDLWADERIPWTGPMLRVDSGMHTALIRRIATDPAGQYVLSVSDDKTLRIWSRGDGKLQLTMRVPIGWTQEGALYAVAFSPDGRTVAVSGQTCVEWEDQYCIYLIDVRGGEVRRRIVNLPEAVTHLDFSPNGAFLAAVFADKAGVRVFSIPTGTQVFVSERYDVPANWVDFAPDGRMVTSAYDGVVRLYDGNFRLRKSMQLAKGSKPHGVAFAPDGSRIAVGFRDRPAVAVLSGEDLTLSYLPDVTGVSDNLWVVAWSLDGQTLYAGGGYRDKGRHQMRWWSQSGLSDGQGRGDYVDVAAGRGHVMQIVPLPEGGIAFASAEPALGVLDGQGFSVFMHERSAANFQGAAQRLLVSKRGRVVEFDLDGSGQQRVRFTVDKLLLSSAGGAGVELHAPKISSAGIRVTGGGEGDALRLNGVELPLQEREQALAVALDPKERYFVLGSSHYVRLYTRSGELRWKVATPGAVWAVNVTDNAQWVVTALADGTIRWYDAMRGEERMALFVHRNQQHWAVWSPKNIFAVSPGADGMLGWHVNRGKNQLADFYPVSHYPDYMKPDYFKQLFGQ
ncbi:MAG: hypothetical protein G8237_09795 [Magnetococcales bacterium]|nr:hypothetical protein [Magnetococcales bacterium]NGZ06636.1 hypothetical protein [Magnetococcales bacterium]